MEGMNTTNGTPINRNRWYVYRWSSEREPEGFISEGFNTMREAIIESGAVGVFHRDGRHYYTNERTHVCMGDVLLQ